MSEKSIISLASLEIKLLLSPDNRKEILGSNSSDEASATQSFGNKLPFDIFPVNLPTSFTELNNCVKPSIVIRLLKRLSTAFNLSFILTSSFKG